MKKWNKFFYYYLPGFLLILFQFVATVVFKNLHVFYFKSLLVSFLLFTLPAILLYYIVFALVKLIRELHYGKIGSRFQAKLLVYFLMIILLLIVPGFIVANHFFGQTFNVWFLTDIKEALNSGRQISQSYKKQFEQLLLDTSHIIEKQINHLGYSPSVFNNLSRKYKISYSKLYKNNSLVYYFASDKNVYNLITLKNLKEYDSLDSIFFTKNWQEQSYLLFLKKLKGHNNYLVLGTKLPSSFSQNLQRLERGYSLYSQMAVLKKPVRSFLFLVFLDFFLVLFFIATVLSILFSKQIAKPVFLLYEATKNIASGQYDFILPHDKSIELNVLINSFNSMLKELAFNQKALVHAKHIDAWKNMTLRNLDILHKSYSKISEKFLELKRKNKLSEAKIELDAFKKSLNELGLKIDEMKTYTHNPEKNLKKEDLNDIIRSVMDMFAGVMGNISFFVELDSSLPMIGLEREQIHQGFVNLIKNSIEAISKNQKGLIRIKTSYKKEFSKSSILVEVIDNGVGIPDEILPNIFEPYFSTKKGKQGLGLVIVKKVLQEHKATINYKRIDGNNIFTLEFLA